MSRLTGRRFVGQNPKMPNITLAGGDDWERTRAQFEYAEQASRRRAEGLARRAGRLPKPKDFDEAVKLLRDVEDATRPLPTEVRLRPTLVRTRRGRRQKTGVLPATGSARRGVELAEWNREDLESRPPASRTVRSANALRLLLLSYYVAHVTTSPGASPTNPYHLLDGRPNWAKLMGFAVPREPRRKRMARALSELERAGLVKLGDDGAYSRYEGFTLLTEMPDSDLAYTVPGEDVRFRLPAEFWWFGWHLVLEPGEILTYLMFLELATFHTDEHDTKGVGAPETERWGRYGVTTETYEHHRTLVALELLERMPDTVTGRSSRGRVDVNRHGKPTEVWRFKVNPTAEALSGNALVSMKSALANLVQ